MFLKSPNMLGARCSKSNVKELCVRLDIWDEFTNEKSRHVSGVEEGLV